MNPALVVDGDRVLVPIRVQPRASRTEIVGVIETGQVKIRLEAPPVDGAANQALLRFLGREILGVAPSRLALVRGETGRDKIVAVTGLDAATVAARLAR